MPTVYLADRDASFRKAVAHSLRKSGADVMTFDNGFDLYAHVIEREPDLIVMDNNLKEMNGFQVFGRLMRRSRRLPPVIFVTHFNNKGIVERVLERGALNYLVKNRPFEEILTTIERHLRELAERPIAVTPPQPVAMKARPGEAVSIHAMSAEPVASPALSRQSAPIPATSAEPVPIVAMSDGLVAIAPADRGLEQHNLRGDAAARAANPEGGPAGAKSREPLTIIDTLVVMALDQTFTFVRVVTFAIRLRIALRRQAMSVAGAWHRGLAAVAGFVSVVRDILADAARGSRRIATTSMRLVQEATESVAVDVSGLAQESRVICAEVVAAIRAPTLLRHRAPLVSAAASLALLAGLVTLLVDRSRESEAVMSTERSERQEGARPPAAAPTLALASQEDREGKAAPEPETVPTNDSENGVGNVQPGGVEPRTAPRRSSRSSVNPSPTANRGPFIVTASQTSAAAPVRRVTAPSRAIQSPEDRAGHVAAALPFGPLGQRNEPVWSNTIRTAGNAPVEPGVIDEDRDGVPDVRPPIPVERVAPKLPPEFADLTERRVVWLGVRVGSDGRTKQVEVKRSSGYDLLDEAAVEAVSRFRWQPARAASGPLEQWVELGIAFGRDKES